jgi:transposase
MGSKSKNNYDLKLKAVLSVTEDCKSIRAVAAETGVSRSVVHRWVSLYKEFGKEGLLFQIRSCNYSAEFKLSVIRYMHKNNLSLFKTAIKFGIPHDVVLVRWNRIYNEKGVAGFIPKNQYVCGDMNSKKKFKLNEKTKEELIERLEYLEAENAYLKKLQALVQERIARENGSKQKPSKN